MQKAIQLVRRNAWARTACGKAVFLLALLVGAIFGQTAQADPLLRQDGTVINIREGSRCAPIQALEVKTDRIDLFEDRLNHLQGLIANAIAKLSFECEQLKQVRINGYVSSVDVFSATASFDDGWALNIMPTALERFAGQVGSSVKDISDIAKLGWFFAPYQKVPGIEGTFQYFMFMRAAKEVITHLIGDESGNAFSQHIESVHAETNSFQDTRIKTQPVIDAVAFFFPDRAKRLNADLEKALKKFEAKEWEDYLVLALAEGDIYGDVLSDLKGQLAKKSPDAELARQIDLRVGAWAQDEIEIYESLLDDGFLSDVAEKRLLAKTLFGYVLPATLAETSTALKASALRIEQEAKQELEQLLSDANEIIGQTGDSYADLATVVETGMGLATEFEDAGFEQEAKAVLAAIGKRSDMLLDAGLKALNNELQSERMTREAIAVYRDQAAIFDEMSAEFPGFTHYVAAIERGITDGRERICVEHAAGAVSDESFLTDRIQTGSGASEIRNLACQLYRNDHILTRFERGWLLSPPTLVIDLSKAGTETFELAWAESKNAYLGTKMLGDENSSLSEQAWIEHIDELTILPPSGKPNAAGATECDQLAADPDDNGKMATGIIFEQQDSDNGLDRAIDACVAAIEYAPNEPRHYYQLARILSFLDLSDEANSYAELAMSRNYAPAFYLRAQSRMMDEGDDAFFDAVDLLKTSATAGYKPAKTLLDELIPPGVDFYREIPQPTDEEILSAVDRTTCTGMMNMRLCVRLTRVHRKECFQTSATDFSCELTFAMRCDSAGNPLLSLFTNACPPYSDPQFRTLRRQPNQSWAAIN